MPVLSFTAQAFLFTIALGPGTSSVGRISAAALSILITFLSITLLKSHRIAEVTDSHWLERMERDDDDLPELYRIHGTAIRESRLREGTQAGKKDIWVPRLRGYITWIYGLGAFGLAAIAVIVITVLCPGILG
ncbi:MAG: hypothetical protein KKH51_06010 [Actinobacteria bacterium]|nr:hypothetical protein [Actinomycetota bacterium]